MSNQNNQQLYETIYGDAGLIYLQAPAKIETKDNGQIRSKEARFRNMPGSQNNQNMDQTQANIIL